jgi:hypothetical protein
MSARRIVMRLITVVMAAAAVAALAPSAAQASSGYINVQYTPDGVSPTSSVGLVSVSIQATSPLNSLTVSVYSGSTGGGCFGGTDVLDLPMSDFSQPANDGDSQYGTWTLSTPITTSQLSLGSYQVCLTATDTAPR